MTFHDRVNPDIEQQLYDIYVMASTYYDYQFSFLFKVLFPHEDNRVLGTYYLTKES